MVANPGQQPIFIQEPINVSVTLTNQTTTRSGGSISPVPFVTAGPSGALIESISVLPLSNEAANVIRIFTEDDDGYNLILETSLAAVSGISDAAGQPRTTVGLLPLLFPTSSTGLRLAPNQVIHASLGVVVTGSGWKATAVGGQYEVTDE